jgi:DnaJ-class molecular chaperone
MKKTKTFVVDSTCPKCAGRGFVPHHHVTNRRNRRACPACDGKGETKKQIIVEE